MNVVGNRLTAWYSYDGLELGRLVQLEKHSMMHFRLSIRPILFQLFSAHMHRNNILL